MRAVRFENQITVDNQLKEDKNSNLINSRGEKCNCQWAEYVMSDNELSLLESIYADYELYADDMEYVSSCISEEKYYLDLFCSRGLAYRI